MEQAALGSFLLGMTAVIALVLVNAFFVAAEFALVAARKTRIATLARQGDRKAKLALKAVQSLDRYISATQLGITLASLGLGWIGEPAIAHFLEQLFVGLPSPWSTLASHGVATAIAFSVITVLHIVLGELAPKALALLHPEKTSLWTVPPLMVFTIATNPIIYLLNGAANLTLRLFGMRVPEGHERVHQPEEIVMLARQSALGGQMERGQVKLIEGVFEFSEKIAREVMTPRTDVVGLQAGLTVDEATKQVATVGRSRYPVFGESLDDIVGIVHAKQLLKSLATGQHQPLTTVMSAPLFVPGTRDVEDIMTDMQRLKQHMAIVLDEFGGTAGIVTMEDIIEEIVGEIEDEYDTAVEARAFTSGDPTTTVPGTMEFDDANARFDLQLDTDVYQTIGGYVFGTLGRLPKPGDRVTTANAILEVVSMDGRRIGMLRIVKKVTGGGRTNSE